MRQERLTEALAVFLKRLDTVTDIDTTRINTTGQDDYRDFYDAELKALVEENFCGDLQTFGYGFNGPDDQVIVEGAGEARFDHSTRRYTKVPASASSNLTSSPVLFGRLADVDLHQWGSEVLSHFTTGSLVHELGSRVGRRVAASFKGAR